MSEVTANPDGSVNLNDEYGTVVRFDEDGNLAYTATIPLPDGKGTMGVSMVLPISDLGAMERILRDRSTTRGPE